MPLYHVAVTGRDRRHLTALGAKAFSAAQIRRIVETMDVILFPQVNPDGRRFSMEDHPMWRTNRRPAPKGRGHRCAGVDLNRNFPFMWRFDRYFAPETVQSSFKPGDYETYRSIRPTRRCAGSCGRSPRACWSSACVRGEP
jgi:hypothetical protein